MPLSSCRSPAPYGLRARTLRKPQTVTAAESHRLGQTEGGTTVKQLVKPAAEVRHDYKDGAVDRGLGKWSVVLAKVQD